MTNRDELGEGILTYTVRRLFDMPAHLEEKPKPDFEWHYSINPAEVSAVEVVSLDPHNRDGGDFAGRFHVLKTTRHTGIEAYKLASLWRAIIPRDDYLWARAQSNFGVRFYTKEGVLFEAVLSYKYCMVVQQFPDGKRTVTGFWPYASAAQQFQLACLKSLRRHPDGIRL